jgi:hypothetical protein
LKITEAKLAIGYWLLAIGYWLLAIGYWLLAIEIPADVLEFLVLKVYS